MFELEFKNVTKYYNQTKALDNASFQIQKGDFCFIIGKSGAGKSTLLKLLSAQETPSSGDIFFRNKCISTLTEEQLVMFRRKIGVMTNEHGCIPYLTVYQNVELALLATNTATKKNKQRIISILSTLGIKDKISQYPNELSQGQQARVLLARALITNPTFLVLDEPTANLHYDAAWDLMLLLQDLNQRGMTIIVSTHAYELVTIMQKRVLTLVNGSIVSDLKHAGYSDDVLNSLNSHQK